MLKLFKSSYFEKEDMSRFAFDQPYPPSFNSSGEEVTREWYDDVFKEHGLSEPRLCIFRFQIFLLVFGKSGK